MCDTWWESGWIEMEWSAVFLLSKIMCALQSFVVPCMTHAFVHDVVKRFIVCRRDKKIVSIISYQIIFSKNKWRCKCSFYVLFCNIWCASCLMMILFHSPRKHTRFYLWLKCFPTSYCFQICNQQFTYVYIFSREHLWSDVL